MTGVVTTYFPGRKYGFIKPDDGSRYRFFHITNYRSGNGTPTLGEPVSFDLGDPNTLGKEKQAVNVYPLKAEANKATAEGGAL